jgi:hypothetical protein
MGGGCSPFPPSPWASWGGGGVGVCSQLTETLWVPSWTQSPQYSSWALPTAVSRSPWGLGISNYPDDRVACPRDSVTLMITVLSSQRGRRDANLLCPSKLGASQPSSLLPLLPSKTIWIQKREWFKIYSSCHSQLGTHPPSAISMNTTHTKLDVPVGSCPSARLATRQERVRGKRPWGGKASCLGGSREHLICW